MENNIIEIENSLQDILKSKLSRLPTGPGVYLHKNNDGKIIYIGKAKNLRNRVRSYFQQNRPVDAKTKVLMSKIADFEVIVTDSEAEALILEDTLVKKHRPKYNINLKDDKSYPYVRVTNEEYPRIFPTRKIIRDGSKYFGPYTEVRNMKQVMRILRELFQLRSCDFNITDTAIEKKKFKLCLDYHIEKCNGTCQGLITKEKYLDSIKNSIQILNGKTRDVEKRLEAEMERLANELKFEEAAKVRNQYLLLREFESHQKIVSAELFDRDVIGMARIEDTACTLVFKVRDGKLIGKRHFIITDTKDQPDEALIQSTIEKWYLESEFVPSEIFLPCEPEQPEFIMDWLRKMRGRALELHVPKLGEKKKLVAMAAANAEFQLREYHLALAKRDQIVPRPIQALQRDLRLAKPPLRIECFDNSHIQGSELVSSLVVFENGKAKKSDYRKFKIETVNKNDDFAAMREAVMRRYKRLLEEINNENATPLPDLIIIDGGKGQLSSAVQILTELGLAGKITVIGLAKRLDEIFFPGKSDSLLLPRASSSLKLIQQIRDEAHRFAITFHRKLRDKRTLQTELTEIPGIGTKIAQKLLIEFGSVENIKNADEDSLKKVLNDKAVKAVAEHFG